jgi:hypothetical protein
MKYFAVILTVVCFATIPVSALPDAVITALHPHPSQPM